MTPPARHFDHLAAAYVRGSLPDLPSCSNEDALGAGADAGIRIHRFKRTSGLQRVRKVLGILQGLAPAELLDVGSGRGVFLWPLLDRFPAPPVTAIDVLDYRVADIDAVRRGGIDRLTALRADVTDLPLVDDAVDCSTALEVLEHLENPAAAAAELVRVTRRFVVASVPSKADDNPEHIQLFDGDSLRQLFLDAGARRVGIEYILNHIIAVVTLP